MNFSKANEKRLGLFWKVLFAVAALIFAEYTVIADSDAPTPFHLIFQKYEKEAVDGSYMFYIRFDDIPIPHVDSHSASNVRSFKIGDTIGRYKIVKFQEIIVPAHGEAQEVDQSELTLQNMNKTEEKLPIKLWQTYDMPLARFSP